MTNIQLASPEDIFEAINWALSKANHGMISDRRISDRTVAHIPIVIQPVDADCQPVGDSFEGITKDVSVGGLGMICSQPVEGKQVLVQFSGDEAVQTTLLLNVHYCNNVGPYFFAGASFCADWSTELE